MKKAFSLILLGICFLSSCSSDSGSSSNVSAPPDIINPSFEELGDNPDGGQPDGWVREGVNDWNGTTLGVRRETALGFMPTNGQYFLEFPASDRGTPIFPGSYPLLVAYQDDVNLSRTTDLFFDYEVSDVFIQAGAGIDGYDGAARVAIYFQPNAGGGTTELWVKDFGPGAASEQVLDMSVPVPEGLGKGRLTIEVSADASKYNSLVVKSELTFRIDYLGL